MLFFGGAVISEILNMLKKKMATIGYVFSKLETATNVVS